MDDSVARRRQVVGNCSVDVGPDYAGSKVMYLPFILTAVPIGLCAALVAWYYNREFQCVRYEYLGSTQSGMSGHADAIYLSLVRPLRTRRLIALCIAALATSLAVLLVGLQNA
jgi:hypothetical protein